MNETHELNKNGRIFAHGDGWGIVLKQKEKIESYKLDQPCWEDPKFDNYKKCHSNFVLLHARKASSNSPKGVNFAHPFLKENWYFCHNGTIFDFHERGKTDSEILFSKIIDNLKQAGDVKKTIQKTINTISGFSAINFILTDGVKGYVVVKYKRNPDYYTMKYLETEEVVIVASEVLSSTQGKWTRINDNMILELDVPNGRINSIESI